MKKKILLVSLSILIIVSCLLAACAADNLSVPNEDVSTSPPTANYTEQIRRLEEQIAALNENQSLSREEYQKKLNALTAELESLRTETDTTPEESPKEESKPAPSEAKFTYTVSEGKATITGYTGSESSLVIPSAIDGYAVHGIADSAFSSPTLKSVTISSGIVRIDWFAFCECQALESITIPASVSSIGYSAFPAHSKTLTVYCHANSFALTYAKSYGLNYAVI